jgi:hypothetical protein
LQGGCPQWQNKPGNYFYNLVFVDNRIYDISILILIAGLVMAIFIDYLN